MLFTTRAAAIVAVAGIAIAGAGVALAPTIAAAARASGIIPDTNCNSSSPCISGVNAGNGAGAKGQSTSGNGVVGQTNFASTLPRNGTSGVLGEDKSTTGTFDAGIRGTSSRGAGVIGVSNTGDGILGKSATGVGVKAHVTGGSGDAIDAFNTGGGNLIQGFDFNNNSVFLLENSGNLLDSGQIIDLQGVTGGENFQTSVGGYFLGTGAGVEGSNQPGSGSNTGVAVLAEGYGGPLIVGNNSSFVNSIVADDAGNLTITGLLFTGGVCSSGCAKTASSPGTHLLTYAPRESLPTMEDFGEGRMMNGEGYVHLDPAFANGIDLGASYMVFITPEGDSRGVYVTSKTSAGFSVRENQGGRSTLTFSWRIVAKPYGVTAKRLPMIQMAADKRFRRHR